MHVRPPFMKLHRFRQQMEPAATPLMEESDHLMGEMKELLTKPEKIIIFHQWSPRRVIYLPLIHGKAEHLVPNSCR